MLGKKKNNKETKHRLPSVELFRKKKTPNIYYLLFSQFAYESEGKALKKTLSGSEKHHILPSKESPAKDNNGPSDRVTELRLQQPCIKGQ